MNCCKSISLENERFTFLSSLSIGSLRHRSPCVGMSTDQNRGRRLCKSSMQRRLQQLHYRNKNTIRTKHTHTPSQERILSKLAPFLRHSQPQEQRASKKVLPVLWCEKANRQNHWPRGLSFERVSRSGRHFLCQVSDSTFLRSRQAFGQREMKRNLCPILSLF